MDEADALTDLREPGGWGEGLSASHCVAHKLSGVTEVYNKTPRGKEYRGVGEEARSLKKRTKTTKSDCIQGLISISFHQQRMPLVLIQ